MQGNMWTLRLDVGIRVGSSAVNLPVFCNQRQSISTFPLLVQSLMLVC